MYDSNNTRAQLSLYFSNKVAAVRVAKQLGIEYEVPADKAQAEFIKGMELTKKRLAQGSISQSEGIGESQLDEILAVARTGDWDAPKIREIYATFSQVTGTEFDEEIFEGME